MLTNQLQNDTNSSENFTASVSKFETYPTSLLHFAATCCIAFTIFGTFGNSLTMVALLKSPRLKNATSVFIINLCIVDGFFCLFSFPLAAATFIRKSWPFSDLLCKFYLTVGYSNATISLNTVVAITINRYVIIVHPKSYDKVCTKASIYIIILGLWIWSFLYLLPVTVGIWGKSGFISTIDMCTILDANGKSAVRVLYAVAFFVSAFVFIFCYTRIYLTVRKSETQLRSNYGSSGEGTQEKSILKTLFCFRDNEEEPDLSAEGRKKKKKLAKDLRLLRMILTIFIIFLISYTPSASQIVFKKGKHYPVPSILGHLGVYFTTIVNPVVYVVMSREYRKAYLNLFVRTAKNNSGSNMTS